MVLDRRTLLSRSAVVAGGTLLGGGVLQGLSVAQPAQARMNRGRANHEIGYGELRPTSPVNEDPQFGRDPMIALPEGFSFAVFGVEGTEMSDGRATPKGHDGMAALPLADGTVRLVRNHEDRDAPGVSGLDGDSGAPAYDQVGPGGTTSLRVRPDGNRELIEDFVSLQGTIVNCAGGPTPWGSWITSEESTGGLLAGWQRPHGYNFEVPASATAEVDAEPLTAMGRFVHEAVAVDPRTGTVYETEDRGSSGFYRFLPTTSGRLADGGRLQMLAVRARPGYDTRAGQRVGRPLPVEWVDIPDPDPADAEANSLAVYQQGLAGGGATFARLEGCWYGGGSVFFNSTNGGDAGKGQVWQYVARGPGRLVLVYESPGEDFLDNPDNITVSPRGGVLLCEDGDNEQYLRGLSQRGQIFDFALNIFNELEWAGATFSPDGETLFVNVQGDTRTGGDGNLGRTFAIWGPWERSIL